ncbi:MAG TPA: glycosyltransferase family 39 protein [Candidatus Rubrimentiphilum sp.]|nr:glycosyltransferase family 39 protein [Candidatus Rubrimentiphilum sp.]
MRASRIGFVVWGAVVLVTVLRAIFDATLPLTGDEAYYWEWSRRLAGGYVDHPPAVAFAIAAFAWLGRTPFAVRLPFVLCGLGTAIAAAGAANVLSGDRRAGWIAALAVSLAPWLIVAFGMVSPDGPFALAWALTLYCAARAFRGRSWQWFVLLGVALGFALLSRFFAVALAAGLVAAVCAKPYRALWPRLAVSLAVACLVWSPFLIWNASHDWISFTFAIVQRHEPQFQLVRPLIVYLEAAFAFSPGLWIAATIVAARSKEPLVTWTAVPLCVALLLLALRERVEIYWFIGPFISLAVGLGVAFVQWSPQAQRRRGAWIFAPAVLLSALVFFAGIWPGVVYAGVRHAGVKLSDGGPFEMFTYRPLAKDVRAITQARGAYAMTDGYGFSSLLDFYGELRPVLIGYDAQGQEALRWFGDRDRPQRMLFVDKIPLAQRTDFQKQLALACARVVPGPVLRYPLAGSDRSVPPRPYYTTWCEGMKPDAMAILRWQAKT